MRSEPENTRARRRAPFAVMLGSSLTVGAIAASGLVAALPLSAPGASGTAAVFASPAGAVAAAADTAVAVMATSTDDAQNALDGARAALGDASALTTEIDGSGLDLGVDTSIDTAALRDAADRLAAANTVPVLLFPALADDAVAATQTVAARTAELRGTLESVRAQQAADEAAATAQREAEEAAAAEAARQAEALAAANTPEGAKAVAAEMAASRYGWGAGEFSCLVSLWNRESGWDYQAYNADSGATGIPQALPGSKMASAGSDWATNAATQIAWGLGYIAAAYGTPCGAWAQSEAVGWY